MTNRKSNITRRSRANVDAFLEDVSKLPSVKAAGTRGRLIFALDATMSRQPAWDRACAIQAEMFDATADLGGLAVQMVYFRGHGEFHVSRWTDDAKQLGAAMTDVRCRGGFTQIEKVLQHAVTESAQRDVKALVYVGDCMEEDADRLCNLAGTLGLKGVPAFVFQDGRDPAAEPVFREIARLSNGAYRRFDVSSADQLRELLRAVAVYASGGDTALESYADKTGGEARRLIAQLKSNRR